MWTWTRTQTGTWTWNWNPFARYPYGGLVPIALYGLPMTHYGGSSNGTKNKWRRFLIGLCHVHVHTAIELFSKEWVSRIENTSVGRV
jgi:hypothetical protein